MSEDEENVELTSLQSISRGASIFVVGRVLRDALQFLFTAVLTRGLGSNLYGVFAYANTFVTIALVFTNLGSDKALLKYIPEYEDEGPKRRVMVGLAYLTSFVASFVVAAALFVLAPLITRYTIGDPMLTDVLRLFSLLLVFDTMVKVLNSTFRSLELLEYQVLVAQIVKPTVRLLAAAIALALGASFYGVMVSLVVAGGVVVGVALVLFLTRISLRPSVRPSQATRADASEYYNFSIPLLLKDAGAIFRSRIDVLMVGFFLSSTAVGVYDVSVLIAGLLSLPLAAINQLFPPVAARLYTNGDLKELNEVFSIVTRWILTASLIVAVPALLYRTEILALFGEEFTMGAGVLVFFVVGRILSNAVGPSGYLLMVSEHQYVLLVNQWTFGVLNVIINYIFILEFGLIGAAFATAAVNGTVNIVKLVEIWYLEGMYPYSRAFFKPFAAAGGAAAVMYGVSLYASGAALLAIGTGLGLLSYGGVLWLLGIEQKDREFFRSVVPT